MALARVVSEIFNVEKCRDLEIPNASMMGLPDGRKSFKIVLVVLIQYRLCQTDSQPATQPPRHVAVANTRYAIASRLKTVAYHFQLVITANSYNRKW